MFSGASLLAPDRVAGQTTDNPSAPTATDAVTPLSAATVPSAVENSVVKIFCTIRAPDVYHPWTKGTPQQISGSGVVIEGGHILTNAHVVSYASQIQVQAAHSGEKISAKVELIATGIDLAVLSLDDPTFFAPIRRCPMRRKSLTPRTLSSSTVSRPAATTSLSPRASCRASNL